MDRRNRVVPVVIAVLVLGFSMLACESTGSTGGYPAQGYVSPSPSPTREWPTSTPRTPSARELAAIETAQAEETHEALEKVAKATADALALQDQATRQALDLNGTRIAQEAQSTREAWEFSQTQEAVNAQQTGTAESSQATATREAIDATKTAMHDQATGTAVQWNANVQGTQAAAAAYAVESTRQAIQRQNERETVTQPLRAWWGWVVLAFAVPALGFLGWRFSKVIEDRARVVKRRANEGEPFVLLEQTDEEGNKRIALPLRSFNALLDTGDVPALPSAEDQDKATMRQQTANAIQARQAAAIEKAKKAHRAKPPTVIQASPQRRAIQAPRRQRKRVPGLVKVVPVASLQEATKAGVLSPPLAASIEGQWEVVGDDD